MSAFTDLQEYLDRSKSLPSYYESTRKFHHEQLIGHLLAVVVEQQQQIDRLATLEVQT